MKPVGPVLVVEDDFSTRRVIVNLLTAKGFQVVTAENGLEALERLRSLRPSVVLLDLTMPLLDGPGFVKEAHSHADFLPPVPIIGLSGLPDGQERAERLGLADCLLKPVDPEDLVRRVVRRSQSA